MTRVGTGQSSPPLYRIHKNGKYHGGGGGWRLLPTGSRTPQERVGVSPEDTCVSICIWVRRTRGASEGVGRVSKVRLPARSLALTKAQGGGTEP